MLKDKLSTRDLVQRKGMELDSHTCDLCILQKNETTTHLFLRCNFAKTNGQQLVFSQFPPETFPRTSREWGNNLGYLSSWKLDLEYMEHQERLDIQKDRRSVQSCNDNFFKEFMLLRHRVKTDTFSDIAAWIESFSWYFFRVLVSFLVFYLLVSCDHYYYIIDFWRRPKTIFGDSF